MKKHVLVLCIVFSLFYLAHPTSGLAAPGVAQAQTTPSHVDESTRFGLGYDVDLNGITFRIGPVRGLRFDISLGFGIGGSTGGGPARFDLTPGFRILFPIIAYKALVVQGLFGLQPSFNVVGDTNTTINLSFFGGIMPEIFILPRLSVEILFGLAFNINDITGTPQISLGTIGKGISIVSGAAFHWYF